MGEIGRFLTEYASPVARAAGFERKGQKFRRADEHGNLALLLVSPGRLRTLTGPGAAEMAVTERFCLATAVGFRTETPDQDPKLVENQGVVWSAPVFPPEDVRIGTGIQRQYWSFRTPEERARTGRAFAARLATDVFPRLVDMFDPNFLLDYPAKGDGANAAGLMCGLLHLEVFVGLQQGTDADQFGQWIERSEQAGYEPLTEWLRARAARLGAR